MYKRQSDKLVENVFENYKDILKNLDIPNKKLKEREYMYNEKGMILARCV